MSARAHLSELVAAVYDYFGAGDVLGVLAGKIQRCIGDVLRFANPLYLSVLKYGLRGRELGVCRPGDKAGEDEAGHDVVDADAALGELGGQRAGHEAHRKAEPWC